MSAASLGKASEDRPWKDLDQSTRLESDSLSVRFEEGGEDRDDSVPFAEAVELTLGGDGVGETVSAARYEVGLYDLRHCRCMTALNCEATGR